LGQSLTTHIGRVNSSALAAAQRQPIVPKRHLSKVAANDSVSNEDAEWPQEILRGGENASHKREVRRT